MKWFEHHTNDRDLPHVKIIRSKFGAEGYGIYISLLEVIGDNVTDDNKENWGEVAAIHDIDSLAVECSTTAEKLKEFLTFCDERKIFTKQNDRLFCGLILERLDNYAKRVQRQSVPTSNKVRTKYEQSTDKVQLSTTLHTQKQIQIHSKEKDKKEKFSGEERGMSASPKLFSSISHLSEEDFSEIADQYQVPVSFVLSKLDDMKNWMEKTGKKYKNYKAALRDWVKRDGLERKESHAKKSSIVFAGNPL